MTDFIQDWEQDVTLREQLAVIFQEQAPWDQYGEYTINTIEAYYENDQTKVLDPKDMQKKATKKYTKLDLNKTLLEALAMPNHYIPQYPVIKIISKESDFRDAFLKEI